MENIVQAARFTRDIASPFRDFVSSLPEDRLPSDLLKREIESWRSWQGHAQRVILSGTQVNSFGAASTAAASTASGTVTAMLYISPTLAPEIQKPVEGSWQCWSLR